MSGRQLNTRLGVYWDAARRQLFVPGKIARTPFEFPNPPSGGGGVIRTDLAVQLVVGVREGLALGVRAGDLVALGAVGLGGHQRPPALCCRC